MSSVSKGFKVPVLIGMISAIAWLTSKSGQVEDLPDSGPDLPVQKEELDAADVDELIDS